MPRPNDTKQSKYLVSNSKAFLKNAILGSEFVQFLFGEEEDDVFEIR